ncbi:MAG: virulence RhuM family protein [Bacteroidales bacterium]|nr:virulence RhuM family protein [Bacteroidales bacterium]
MARKKSNIVPNNSFSEILLYTAPSGKVKVEIFLHNENVWLSQAKIAELFGVERSVVTKHLKNIFDTAELQESSVCAKIAHTASDGKTYQTQFYNLDAIISVGYRVNSTQATHFRIWATERLKEYIIKGFTMDDERLKNPENIFGKDYFDEQLARIRDIRSSERRFYQKITDIYAQCSADYDVNSETTRNFFATVQNKLHWAITTQTAAEIIFNRADSSKQNMGLSTWKNAPNGAIRKTDVSIAKNYLNETELDNLNRIVSMYLDYAEMQANNRKIMYMKDWIARLDAFLQFNEKEILTHTGTVTAEIAKNFAETEFDKFHAIQAKNYESDFDKLLGQVKEAEKGYNMD